MLFFLMEMHAEMMELPERQKSQLSVKFLNCLLQKKEVWTVPPRGLGLLVLKIVMNVLCLLELNPLWDAQRTCLRMLVEFSCDFSFFRVQWTFQK